MAWIYKTKFGKGQIEINEQDFKMFCDKVGLVGEFPHKCGLCGSEDIHLYHKSPKGNDYYGFKCSDCGAEQNLHQRKEGGFYIRYDDQWSKYEASEKSEEPPPKKFDDEIPY